MAGDLCFRSRPEQARRPHSLAFGQAPERYAAIPASIGHRRWIADAIAGLLRLVVKVVGNQSVMLGIKPSDDGEMIRECNRRIARKHAFRSPDSLAPEGKQMAGVVALCIIP